MTFNSRFLLGLVATLSLGAVGIALVSQYAFDMPPCAWCVMQRLIYLAIGGLCLLGLLLPAGLARRALASLGVLLAASGVLAAWYQFNVAAKLFSCDQTFADRFMTSIGLDAAVPWLFGIYASCMDAVVHVLGIEYAIWSLSLFVVLGLLLILAATRRA
ncbi:Periplasmic thiol:disulfide oxidoreductase DsbB, required for DsbA reoxidation [plant metagenome]|uniref:Periplasmic thiol:disulfide oxidoreductase DsbB, required for DsbA reoxidation n=2 Tax=root TaxID=1 RepID=A0A1C3JX79_9BURK|nr:disulfide bond formation protein B [Orrella dioscoreae]SBT23879.1 Periplasmic thiol:disulfide oxidoreductase DsbB, required for DsbA reoxidation [Orrella dioscoreae]SOE49591.1 Periplasmic thiol:disulfide oxidoreductase DsbB, required for DsbA reoxidation [Orrella dioscoreae]